jgi:Flp pilus assembly pilin Flp
MTARIRSFIVDDNGQDVVEYGLLAAFISVSAILAIRAIGPPVQALYEMVAAKISS